ncbi:MAG TPA: CAP domain-containing protein [Acidobacteriaceae bacterium]|nr:CAP domain-containing protein [Acidobacteriaceae bacterium]
MGLRLVVGLVFCAVFSQVRAQAVSVAEQYLFQAANAERASRGLPTLRWDAALYRAAQGHSLEMARRESISHQYPGEPELAARGKSAGARFSLIAENVAEAQTAVRIHDAWMNSPGHRANLLDPHVDAVGISVRSRNGQLYAVQDFERAVESLTLEQQEQAVGRLVAAAGPVAILPADEGARRTCAQSTGFAGARQPMFVMRYTSGDLLRIPDALKVRVASGKYSEAAVGACAGAGNQPFSTYSIAVLLYP